MAGYSGESVIHLIRELIPLDSVLAASQTPATISELGKTMEVPPIKVRRYLNMLFEIGANLRTGVRANVCSPDAVTYSLTPPFFTVNTAAAPPAGGSDKRKPRTK